MKKLLLLLLVSAVTGASSIMSVPAPPKLVDLQWWDAALAKSDSLTVLEGLPTSYERNVRAAELKRVPTFEIGGQALYLRPLEISAGDRHNLMEIFRSTQVLVPPPIGGLPMKFCGGFHADYAIRWTINETTLVYSLICFGCSELRLVDGDVVVTADMTKQGREALAKILLPYRQERPPFRLHQSPETNPLPAPPPKLEYKP